MDLRQQGSAEAIRRIGECRHSSEIDTNVTREPVRTVIDVD
jgi:hypothetical protein